MSFGTLPPIQTTWMTKGVDITCRGVLWGHARLRYFGSKSRVHVSVGSDFYYPKVQISLQGLPSTFYGYVETPHNCGLRILTTTFACLSGLRFICPLFRRFFRVMSYSYTGCNGIASGQLVPFERHRLSDRVHDGVTRPVRNLGMTRN